MKSAICFGGTLTTARTWGPTIDSAVQCSVNSALDHFTPRSPASTHTFHAGL
jgi:hypothetical protein